ncbi:unnamed protein product [Prunus brigantina]
MRSIERAWGLRASDRPIGSVFTRHVRLVVPATSTRPASSFVSHGADVGKECYLVDPAGSHMLVSKIKPCMWFDSGEGARETATTSKEGSRARKLPNPDTGSS